ncbi:MAG: phosphoglucosamine mutase [Christensenellales bacterium]|jgi:phosphoglucosamine mutase
MARLFGTDGVRGVANTELTAQMAFQLGQAGAYVLGQAHRAPRILVGKDTRVSGDMLECALAAGICSVGGEAIFAGVMTTPGVAYLARKYGCAAGAVISASHNPMEYNGIKFFDAEGFKLPDAVEDEIEAVIRRGGPEQLPAGAGLGRTERVDGRGDYLAFLKGLSEADLTGLKIVVDCANGAASALAPQLLRDLGAEVVDINDSPDGRNINDHCGSTYLKPLQRAVLLNHAHLGLAFDGDADRMLAVDELGRGVDGDQIMAICAMDMKSRGLLDHDTLVVTVMSNLGLDIAMRKRGIRLEKTAVGDRYVLERMKQGGFAIGGEQSGHVILLHQQTTGDGLVSALYLLGSLRRAGKPLSELAGTVQVLPQILINARVGSDKEAYKRDSTIMDEIARIEAKYQGEGRVLIRPSGTEPLVRVMIEGADLEDITREANDLATLISQRMA